MARPTDDKADMYGEEDKNGNLFLVIKYGLTSYRIPLPQRDKLGRAVTRIGYGVKERLEGIIAELQNWLDNTNLDNKYEVKKLANRHGSEGKFFLEASIYSCDFKFKAILKERDWSAESMDAIERAYHLGVEAGGLTQDFYWKFEHEDAAVEGHRHREGRETGRPAATARRKQLGKRSRQAVISAAQRIVTEDVKLRFNLTRLARAIEAEKLDALRKADGTFLGHHAIYKHLQAARNSGQI